MKEYIAPSIYDTNEYFEGVYAASGSIVTPPEPPSWGDEWDLCLIWDNHNGGQKSYLRLKGKIGATVDWMKVEIRLNGDATVTGLIHQGEGVTTCKLDGKGIEFERTQHYNKGETVNILIGAFTFDSPSTNPQNTGAYYPDHSWGHANDVQVPIGNHVMSIVGIGYR